MRQVNPFTRFAKWAARTSGSPAAFLSAALIIIVWGTSGPIFHYSDTWQLVINTGTTIITFLMVFLIQNTQNRDTAAMQVKLDELIRAVEGAHNALLDLEELDDRDLEKMRTHYQTLAQQARELLHRGGSDTECVEVEQGTIDEEPEEKEERKGRGNGSRGPQRGGSRASSAR